MHSAIARLIRARRRELQLTQQALADRVGVIRQSVVRWETGRRPVPEHLFSSLGQVLSISLEDLHGLHRSAPHGSCITIKGVPTRLLPVKCSTDDMLDLGRTAWRMHEQVLSRLGNAKYDEFSQSFLRDTPYELLAAHHLLALEASTLEWLAPLEASCTLLVVPEDKRTYTGHYRQLAIRFREDNEEALFYPQVPLVVVKSGLQYRVDFLVTHRRRRGRRYWMVVELDGSTHDYTKARDRDRTADLLIPVIRFDNDASLRGDFAALVMNKVRQAASYLRTDDVEYRRFVRRKKALRSTA